MTRRQLLSNSVKIILLGGTLGVAGCIEFEPKPFILGQEIAPPTGCKVLRREDKRADC